MKATHDHTVKYSVIALIDEVGGEFSEYLEALNAIFVGRGLPFEIILVANGIGQAAKRQLETVQGRYNTIRVFELSRRTSQATALRSGFEESGGEIIVVCGSQQEIASDSITDLLDSLDDGCDIVNSWRQQRLDSTFNQFQSNAFNGLIRLITKSELHDLSSAVKVFRREVLEETEFYGNMYRFLPIVAAQKGFKTKEVPCRHYQWSGKTGPCTFSEYVERVSDVFTLYFLTRFAKKPLRFFSFLGVGFLLSGLAISAYVFGVKFLLDKGIGDRPMLLIGLFLMVLGVQAASMGLLGEIIAFTHGRHKPTYTIEKLI
jgi:hypothetical protein